MPMGPMVMLIRRHSKSVTVTGHWQRHDMSSQTKIILSTNDCDSTSMAMIHCQNLDTVVYVFLLLYFNYI